MFVPLAHPPGEAQANFGEALVVIAGVEQKAHFLAMDCPHSDDGFVAAFPGETTESFQQGHVLAFEYFGAVPTRILYDNTKIAVARILPPQRRRPVRGWEMPTPDTPQLLLEHHLKALRLPTILREYRGPQRQVFVAGVEDRCRAALRDLQSAL